jgi:hypothetical protein
MIKHAATEKQIANLYLPREALPTPKLRYASTTHHKSTGKAPRDHFRIPRRRSFWGNYTYGDYASAEEAFQKACYEREIFIPEQEAIDWATTNGSLNCGAYLIDVVDAMEGSGFVKHDRTYDDDGAVFAVDWTNAISIGPGKLEVTADQLVIVWWANGGSAALPPCCWRQTRMAWPSLELRGGVRTPAQVASSNKSQALRDSRGRFGSLIRRSSNSRLEYTALPFASLPRRSETVLGSGYYERFRPDVPAGASAAKGNCGLSGSTRRVVNPRPNGSRGGAIARPELLAQFGERVCTCRDAAEIARDDLAAASGKRQR